MKIKTTKKEMIILHRFVQHSVRKFFAIILSLLLCISLLPMLVFADDGLQMNTPGNYNSESPLGLESTEGGEVENMSGEGIPLNLDDISGEEITQNLESSETTDDEVLILDDKEKGDGLNQFKYSSGWNYSDSDLAFNRSNHYTSQSGAYLTLRFIGTQIRVYSPKGGSNGDAAYSIDGGSETIVSLYADSNVYSSLVYESPQLVRGEHTLKIRRTGTGLGAYINVDRVEILGADEFDKGELIWSDEFDGTELERNKWDPWWCDFDGSFQFPGNEDMVSPDFYSVENGVVKIGNGKYAEGNTKNIGNRTALRGTTSLITKYTHQQTYGYIEVSVRKKTDKPANGLAVWAMPGDGFIGSKHGGTGAEIDLIENDFGGDREKSQSNTIWNGYSDGYTCKWNPWTATGIFDGNFHTIALDWTSEHLRFYYDGKLVAVHTKSTGDAVPQGPEFFILQSDNSDEYDYGYYEVDYVRCYQRPGEGSIGRAPYTDENMVNNGYFEYGNIDGWTVGSGQANTTTSNTYSGQNSLKMSAGAVVSQKMNGLVPGQKYRMTLWASAGDVDETVSVELKEYSIDNQNNYFTTKKETVKGTGYQKITMDFVMHSYWKWPTITIKNDGLGFAYVDDIEIVQLNDLALHKPASASAILDNNLFYEPQKAVDGYENTNASTDDYLNTPWSASSTKWAAAGDTPQWLKVDFKEEQTIRSYQVRHAGAYEDGQVNTRDFVFQASMDGVNWTDLDTVTGNLDNVTQHNVEPTDARYVRLYITNPQTEPGNKVARIYEFSVFDTYFDIINGDIIVNDNPTGGSNNQFNYSGSWTYNTFSTAYYGDNHYSNTTNNYYTVAFNGTQIKLYGCKTPNNGIAAISIDGGAETYVDCYSSITRKFELLYASPTLSSGQHTLKVRVTGTKNSNSSDCFVNADMIDITPTTVTINDNTTGTSNSQFNYSGSWTHNNKGRKFLRFVR